MKKSSFIIGGSHAGAGRMRVCGRYRGGFGGRTGGEYGGERRGGGQHRSGAAG